MPPSTSTPARGLRRGQTLAVVAAGVVTGVVASAVAGLLVWSAPREDVRIPGPDATPEAVALAYLDAVAARDFDTAEAIRPDEHLGRFSRPSTAHHVEIGTVTGDDRHAHVVFTADFSGGDGTIEDGLWGYYLERGGDGSWRIVDAGVA
ncbi:MAG: hypothetical protein CMH83_14165 [Nocardioides sp.]|nr:hypothetical protein [Nocardioides sp.]